jgi:putative transposase
MANRIWRFFIQSFSITKCINYIRNQEAHHKAKTFKDEYIEFLKLFKVDFKNEYLFEEI